MRVKPSKWGGDAHPMPPPHVQLRIKEHTGRGFRLLEPVVRKATCRSGLNGCSQAVLKSLRTGSQARAPFS